MSDVIAVVATAKAREGRSEELGAAFRALVAPSRADEGSIAYELHRSTADPDLWMVYELWASPQALDAHTATEHLTSFVANTKDLIDGELEITTFTPLTRED